MGDKEKEIASYLVELAESRLSEWDDVSTPLQVAYDVNGCDDEGPILIPTADARYQGYMLWSRRMEQRFALSLSIGENAADDVKACEGHNASQVLLYDASTPQTIELAVDFIALMENARLSFGLSLVYDGRSGCHSEQLFCLHYYDAMMRLVSSTDRLRSMFLSGLYNTNKEEVDTLLSSPFHFDKYFKTVGARLQAGNRMPRRPPQDQVRFLELLGQVQGYVNGGESRIASVRKERNILTHRVGTIPGKRLAAQRLQQADIPYLFSAYDFDHDDPGLAQTHRMMVDKVKQSYRYVLGFGSLIFELDHLVANVR